MKETTVTLGTTTHDAESPPHLSYSRINKYLTCPEQYRLYYIEGLRPKRGSASLVFGTVMHAALAEYFRHGADPLETFRKEWDPIQGFDLRYSQRETWEGLKEKGTKLLELFVTNEAPKFGRVFTVEQKSQIGLSNLDVPFVTVTDLIAELEGIWSLIEFKTAASDYDEADVELSDQLTAYKLIHPELEQVAICVFVKTKEPEIKWHKTTRSPDQIVEYAEKAGIVAGQIQQGVFYKRSGWWCRNCDFLPVCVGDEQRAKHTLASK